jgi:hypothetical protein
MDQFFTFKQTCFAPPQFFVRFFSIFDIRSQVIPTEYTTFSVTERNTSSLEPPVHAVGTADADLRVEGLSGLHGASPRHSHAHAILGVDGCGPVLHFFKGLA